MAEALVGVAFKNLLNLLQSELATFLGVKQNTEQLSSNLELIKAVLDDAEEKQWTNRFINVWLQRLKNAAYVLDDILDECPTESLQHGCLSSFKPKNIMFRYGVGRKLNEMIRELDRIAEAKNKFGLREGVRERPAEVVEWRKTSSTIAQPQVYGRDEDKQKVVEFLLSPARGSDFLSVYPIVGLGGLGKTTLAQLVYNDQGVSNHFDLKIWVCVSENFTMERILCSIIESIMKEKYNILDLDVMERKVQELLQSKRYLLVLDDVWKTNQEFEFGLSQDKWEKLKAVLSCGSKGASILVSTRDKEVARIMGPCQAHDLSPLSDDDCWSLFKQRAFADQEERADLVAIGREIAKKCGGSPLAAKALGGLMGSRSEKKEWLEVKESKLWTLSDGNDILAALRLSYVHLTPTLKQCFAFCAIFPKDADIMKEELIHLWMANGFISARENLDVEEVGNMIWNELYQKSFFQDVRTSDDLGNICFKMHDLVHDLAQSITEQECACFEKIDVIELSRNIHHVGFRWDAKTSFNKGACEKVESLRTLYQLDSEWGRLRTSGWFPANRSLRVLLTSSLKLSLLGNLTHLRYLELHELQIKTLPDSIYNLRRLEILKLISLHNLCRLPEHLTRLQNLRHLVISGRHSLSCMFPNIGKLSHLRTLSIYIVKKEKGHSLAELRNLNLGGELRIEGLANVGSSSEAQEANLKDKEDLRELSLSWQIGSSSIGSDPTESQANAGQVLQGLQPPSSLKALKISYYRGLRWPNWTGNNSILNNLVRLQLDGCKYLRQLPSLGKLPYLRELEISFMDFVQYMDDDECYDGVEVRAFPSLEELDLKGLPNLERLLKLETGDMFPLLSKLTVENCPKLRLSCLPCVKSLCVYEGNNELLRSISSLSSLEDLKLGYDEDMTSFPEGMMNNLNCLQELTIDDFRKLKELPCEIAKPNALKFLTIRGCDELESLPEQFLQGLSSLQFLRIFYCGRLRSLPEGVRHLTSLGRLLIWGCPELRSLPEGVVHLTSLKSLAIYDCPELRLRSLPEGVVHLTSLKSLEIYHCPELRSLPEGVRHLSSLKSLLISNCPELRSLPEGVRHLTSLEVLNISGCPELKDRCQEETGEDWHKINHIPKVNLW